MLELHDCNYFEIHAYFYGLDKNDKMTKRITTSVDKFYSLSHMSDNEIALLAQRNKIDIAVDLAGYTKNSRSGIFAHRAAPIQINYLGFPGTMGTNFIDYIIADRTIIPKELEENYSEKIIALPNSFMPTDNTRKISKRPLTRKEMGLPELGFVFCCFNNSYKISPAEFDIWMRLLLKVEGSVLWLRKSNKLAETNFIKEAKNRGVEASKLVFADKLPMSEHLARYKLADLFLDTFIYNAHTTASEALWSGLPVLTKTGKGFAARVATSLLSAINLTELVTETEDEYEKLALKLAVNPNYLKSVKEKLETNRLSSFLFNTNLYTKHLEDGYQQAFQRYFKGKDPKSIHVSK